MCYVPPSNAHTHTHTHTHTHALAHTCAHPHARTHTDDLVSYFQRCSQGLTPDGGLIIAKENIASDDGDVPDEDDSSVTRCRESFLHVFERSGLSVVRETDQEGFPPELFKVTMYEFLF